MFKFDKEQRVFEVGGVKIGGQPGEYPTVLVGSIFYDRHRIVSNPFRGEFDRRKAESLIFRQEEMSDKVGNPHMLDVVGSTAEALIRYIDFVSSVSDAPFLVDGLSAEVRVSAIRHVSEAGLQDRVIYNSINHRVRKEEVVAIRECGIKSTVCLAFNPKNLWAEGRLDVLLGSKGHRGLLRVAEVAGVEKILVDTAVLDMPSIGLAARTIYLVKGETGLPCGCGPSNATSVWKKAKRGLGPHAYTVCSAGADLATIMMGANFVLYGPIEDAEKSFPACAMADTIVAYNARRYGIRPKVSTHPIFKIF